MTRHTFYVTVTIACLLILTTACTDKRKTIKIVETNFAEEVPRTGNLSFTFNQDLVPQEKIGTWDSTQYITFSPELPGLFRWDSTSVLTFSPSRQLKAATNYTAKLNPVLITNEEIQKLPPNVIKSFHTPYLSLKSIHPFWSLDENDNNKSLPHFKLQFNTKVKPEDLVQKLDIQVEGKTYEPKVITQAVNDELIVVLPTLIGKEDKEMKGKLTLKEGLLPVDGDKGIVKDTPQEIEIPSPYQLTIEEIAPNHTGMEGEIVIKTSQQVQYQNLRNFIELSPAVDFNVTVDKTSFTVISEDFDINKKYQVTVKQELKGEMGGILRYAFQDSVSFGQLKPSIQFANQKGVYLSAKGERNLEVNIVNVPKVNVKIYKIFENNILSYLGRRPHHYNNYDDEYYYEEDYYYEDTYNYYQAKKLGDIIYEKEYNTKEELARTDQNRVVTLDFTDKLKDFQGVYMIEVNSTTDRYLRSRKTVALSDIGLIVKEGRNHVTIFANSLQSATPIPSAEIRVIGKNNQLIDKLYTNSEGVAQYSTGEQPATGFKIAMLTASKGNDFNYLPFSHTKINTSRYDVGGRREPLAGMDAFLYAERDMYRPGETINFSAIIRDSKWNVPGEVPVIVTVTNPSGKEIKRIRKTLNKHGSLETAITLAQEARTGIYSFEVYTTDEILLNSKHIAVEEFMPDRIKVKVEGDKEYLVSGDSYNLTLTATNLFGPPAANRNYEVAASTKRRGFYPPKNKDYNYNISNRNTSFESIFREGKTDQQGQATEAFDIAQRYENMGLIQTSFFATVFDETGRPVNRRESVMTYTQDVFYGLGREEGYAAIGKKIKVPLIAVDKDGEAQNVEAEVKLIKHEFKTVLSKSGGYFRYTSQKEEKILDSRTMTLKKSGNSYSFTPELSGRYEVRIYPPGVNYYVSNSYYAYGRDRTTRTSFAVNNEGQVDIQLDKKSYKAGDNIEAIFKAPFDGKLLVTLETDKVLEHYYLNTKNRTAKLNIPVRANYVPTVYVGATLFKPHGVSEIPLTVAHGFMPTAIEKPESKLPLSIETVEKSRSKTKQRIKVKTAPGSAVTLAVVDEGILQLTNYETPDAQAFFYQKRALEVNSYDVYPYMYPEIKARRSSTGGDGMNMAKRVNPLTNKRVKLVTFWSGIQETDPYGETTFDIDIPQFSGDLRIMALSYRDGGFGTADENMKVADPIVISAALPRFFSPKDTVEVPVILTNTTEKEANCKTSIAIKGPVEIIGKQEIDAIVPPNQEKEVRYRVLAQPQIGQANIAINVNGLGEQFSNETDFTVRPASPLQKVNEAGSIKAGESGNIQLAVNQFIPSSIDQSLVISKSPLVQFSDDLEYLLRYPHGCLEQTISRAFPQIYFDEMAQQIHGKYKDNPNTKYHVQYAIDRLKLMQLYDGGMVYWPGRGTPSWWGTVYAAHFLLEAKKAGYDVDQSMLNKIYDYLRMRLKERETVKYYYNQDKVKKIAPKSVAYSLYVLALANKPQLSVMNYYKGHSDMLSLDSKYLLAGAYALAGDNKKAAQIMPVEFKGEVSKKATGGSFYSPVRDEAIALNVLLEIDPDHPQIGTMAKHVSKALKNNAYLNTQERSFSFLAMGKIAKRAQASDITANISLDGNQIEEFKGHNIKLKTSDLRNGKELSINTNGTGQLYYFWEAEGISADGSYEEKDSYLKVRKTFYDRFGNKVTNNQFKQNDLIVIHLELSNLSNTYVDNIVVSDILPAGFEIENPNVTEVPDVDWIENNSSFDFRDIRDDRINYFSTLTSNETRHFYYVVRAVSKGVFQMGPVGADAMYDGEYHSYSGGGLVAISD